MISSFSMNLDPQNPLRVLLTSGTLPPVRCGVGYYTLRLAQSLCDLDPHDSYHASLLDWVHSTRWSGKAFVTGFLLTEDASRILVAADVAVFPHIDGVLRGGYDTAANTFYARPGDVAAMRQGLDSFAGHRGTAELPTWESVAEAHLYPYEEEPCT